LLLAVFQVQVGWRRHQHLVHLVLFQLQLLCPLRQLNKVILQQNSFVEQIASNAAWMEAQRILDEVEPEISIQDVAAERQDQFFIGAIVGDSLGQVLNRVDHLQLKVNYLNDRVVHLNVVSKVRV
jgi:hypothetical protein